MAKWGKGRIAQGGSYRQFTDWQQAFKHFGKLRKQNRDDPGLVYVHALIPEEEEGYDDLDQYSLGGWHVRTLTVDKFGDIGDWKKLFAPRGDRGEGLRQAIFFVGTKTEWVNAEGNKSHRIADYQYPTPQEADIALSKWPKEGVEMKSRGATKAHVITAKGQKLGNLDYGKVYTDPDNNERLQIQWTRREYFTQPKYATDVFRVRMWIDFNPVALSDEKLKGQSKTQGLRLLEDTFPEIPAPSLRRLRNEYRSEILKKSKKK